MVTNSMGDEGIRESVWMNSMVSIMAVVCLVIMSRVVAADTGGQIDLLVDSRLQNTYI